MPGDSREPCIVHADDEQPTVNDEGVDLTLIRWMLGLSPEERLEELQRRVDDIARLRDG